MPPAGGQQTNTDVIMCFDSKHILRQPGRTTFSNTSKPTAQQACKQSSNNIELELQFL